MTDYFCSCGFWAQSAEALNKHIRDSGNHYRIDKRRWKQVVEKDK